ncbi:hypothetical protein CHS0354_027792, partial [Potamilus streckersoni]
GSSLRAGMTKSTGQNSVWPGEDSEGRRNTNINAERRTVALLRFTDHSVEAPGPLKEIPRPLEQSTVCPLTANSIATQIQITQRQKNTRNV